MRPGGVDLWTLPRSAALGGREYTHATDFREILRILQVLGREDLRPQLRWFRALGLFFHEPIPYGIHREAMAYLAGFVSMGEPTPNSPVGLLDWQADGAEILEGVNAVAGRDVREESHVHWWTFLGWYHCVGPGRLATLVGIRQKLRRGQPLTAEEKEFTRACPHKFRAPESAADMAHRKQLEAMLGDF